MKKIQIEGPLSIPVSADVIANAIPRNSRHCMLDDAIVEYFGGKSEVKFPMTDIRRGVAFTLASTGRRYYYPVLPWIAAKRVAQFDRDKSKVRPFRLRLTMGFSKPSGWTGQRSASASRRGQKYRKTGRTRRTPMPPRERIDGIQSYA